MEEDLPLVVEKDHPLVVKMDHSLVVEMGHPLVVEMGHPLVVEKDHLFVMVAILPLAIMTTLRAGPITDNIPPTLVAFPILASITSVNTDSTSIVAMGFRIDSNHCCTAGTTTAENCMTRDPTYIIEAIPIMESLFLIASCIPEKINYILKRIAGSALKQITGNIVKPIAGNILGLVSNIHEIKVGISYDLGERVDISCSLDIKPSYTASRTADSGIVDCHSNSPFAIHCCVPVHSYH